MVCGDDELHVLCCGFVVVPPVIGVGEAALAGRRERCQETDPRLQEKMA